MMQQSDCCIDSCSVQCVLQEAGKRFGVSYSTISKWARFHGIQWSDIRNARFGSNRSKLFCLCRSALTSVEVQGVCETNWPQSMSPICVPGYDIWRVLQAESCSQC